MTKESGALYVIAAATLGTAAWVWWQNSQTPATDTTGTGTGDTGTGIDFTGTIDDMTSQVSNIFTSVTSAIADPNAQAFLTLIRTGEGTLGDVGYRTLFGGGTFNSFADHPNIRVTRGSLTSTAAGAYQILYGTWLEMKAAYDLPDFSPASQDIAAIGLIKRRGALADVLAGRFDAAIAKCNKEWASLPGSPYGQPTLTLARAHDVLANAGGVQTDGVYA
ncbi:glycoside hydrolase family 24 protein [Pandoraea pnomenusa]|uniref:glycoside hydrolase family 24 protein n=1 Tax=Pandoraea pnomenusa TaxID=93220 RepID=UPI00174EA70D|nr:glycoside hydrolase family 104 protein [Pandoraea pnomenusa]